MQKVIIYTRVSTKDQNTARQVEQLTSNLDKSTYKLIQDKQSGVVEFFKRDGGIKVKEMIAKGQIKELRVLSVDRLGRSLKDIVDTLEAFNKEGVNIYIHELGMYTRIDGKENKTAKMIIGMLGSIAEMERENIKERQAQGIAIAKANNKPLGRPQGTKNNKEVDLLKKYPNIVKRLQNGSNSLREIAKLESVSLSTVQRIKKAIN